MILDKIQADKYLALRLEEALAGVRDEMLEQGKNLQAGATRAIYYTSCFTQNYQDVCAKQKKEDIRFMLAIVKLVREHDVIQRMIRIYIDMLLQNLTPDRIRHIQQELVKQGATFASGSVTNQSLSAAITMTICYSFSLSVTVERALLRHGTKGVMIVGMYGYVQDAAKAADRLKQVNWMYYRALYAETLEMLYFLVEPVISRNPALTRLLSSDVDIANGIMRMIR
ncbi:hypothetical protein [Kosakonia oryziphila]|nr:hypothetical protein [Kosakonia oryziphila]